MAAEAEPQQEPLPQDEQVAEALPTSAAEAFTQALEDAQAAGEPVVEIAEAVADGEAIKTEYVARRLTVASLRIDTHDGLV